MQSRKVLILGSKGYIGTALAEHLMARGDAVVGVDNDLREKNVASVGGQSVTEKEGQPAIDIDVSRQYTRLENLIRNVEPDAVVHLAEQPSAPFSMISAKHAAETQRNNIIGTMNVLWAIRKACPDAHLIKLGTEGEYPDWLWDGKHIPEGNRMKVGFYVSREELEKTIGGKDKVRQIEKISGYEEVGTKPWTIPTPRYAGSWYHFSKLHDSMNIDYACRIWELRATDVNQGVVVGHLPGTRLDVDQHFGTVANRFAAQAVLGMPMTVYGTGEQTRGFIPLRNSVEAITLLINNPPTNGEFRVIHQTTEAHSVNEIAAMVQEVTGGKIEHIENPRKEKPSNRFTFDTSTLTNLGLRPANMREAIKQVVEVCEDNKSRIIRDSINPTTTWS